jgi:hypothetical protein
MGVLVTQGLKVGVMDGVRVGGGERVGVAVPAA